MPRPSVTVVVRIHGIGPILRRAVVATRLGQRVQGLLGRTSLAPEEAMIFPRCNSVHTWFMRMPIDIVFLRCGKVVRVAAEVPAFKLVAVREADTVVELAPGGARTCGIALGKELTWD